MQTAFSTARAASAGASALLPARGPPALPATGPRRRARPGRVAGDGQPARLGLLGGAASWG